MLPNENIEQVKKAKSQKEARKENIKMRVGLFAASSGVLIMLLILFSVWATNDDNIIKLKRFEGLFSKSETSSALQSEADSNISTDDGENLLIIVNSQQKLPEEYSPKIEDFGNIKISKEASRALSDMLKAAEKNGYSLELSSGYISLSQQEKIYNDMYDEYIRKGYSPVKAENEVSSYKSGYCEQNTGLSVMFDSKNDFTLSSAYTWLSEHCVEFGFIQRYPENKKRITGVDFEPRLFRFVGKENALNMRKLGMCLEEYAEYISHR